MRNVPSIFSYAREKLFSLEVHRFGRSVVVVARLGWPRAYFDPERFPLWYWESLASTEVDEFMGGYFDRAKKVAEEKGKAGPLKDPTFLRDYPLLAEVLTARTEVGGRDQNRCSMSIFVHDGLWKVVLRDKQDQTCLWVASQTLAKLFDAVETALESPETEWRLDRYQGHETAKRVKKKLDRGSAGD